MNAGWACPAKTSERAQGREAMSTLDSRRGLNQSPWTINFPIFEPKILSKEEPSESLRAAVRRWPPGVAGTVPVPVPVPVPPSQ